MRVKVRTPSRIHITLIDLNGSLGRIDGGVGLALEEPFVEIEADEAESITVTSAIASDTSRFKGVAEKLSETFGKGIKVEVKAVYPSHVGLGSGTQMSLSVCEAYRKIYGLDVRIREMAKLVGRGGTSGIGVAAFEMGGFIVDGGHSKREKRNFLPSSASKASPAPVIARHDFPDWDVVLVIPNLSGFYGKREVNLFQRYCPIPLEDVRELSHIILMQLLPAVVEHDLDAFSKAIGRIQEIGFKRVEIEQYGDLIRKCLEVAECAGMSSTGPTVYAIADAGAKKVKKDIESYFRDRELECTSVITRANNTGAVVTP